MKEEGKREKRGRLGKGRAVGSGAGPPHSQAGPNSPGDLLTGQGRLTQDSGFEAEPLKQMERNAKGPRCLPLDPPLLGDLDRE